MWARMVRYQYDGLTYEHWESPTSLREVRTHGGDCAGGRSSRPTGRSSPGPAAQPLPRSRREGAPGRCCQHERT
jgi:hypothetical protein